MIVIPAIDILAGKPIQLRGGNPEDVLWQGADPAAEARRWVAAGAKRLHVIDLGRVLRGEDNSKQILEMVRESKVPVQIGGGLRTTSVISQFLGARDDTCAVVATRAWREPDFLDHIATEWPGRIIVALETKGGTIVVRGWTQRLTLTLEEGLFRLAGLELAGVLLTDVDKEGRLEGPNVQMAQTAAETLSVPVIMSGGVSTAAHIKSLKKAGAWGCVVGTALYNGTLDLKKAQEAAI